jgi:hypothetical protein
MTTFIAATPFGLTMKKALSIWRCIIRASFSQERMTYIPATDSSDGAKVVYESWD